MDMESMTIHTGGLPRRYPAAIQVASIGWAPNKRELVDRPFSTYNFSIILSGSGVYRYRGQDQRIQGPCVITQRQHDTDDLARQHNLSPTHFRRLWQARHGCSPQQYAHQIRMRAAARMLVTTQMSVQAIAAATGYSDPLYFSKRFRAFFSQPPSDYRRYYLASLAQK